ncbi:hypothetical protein KCP74_18325 [Salmonella enterica subsp. enterica]|nr:hypothetical protein KCP74_18325 [Salmonella enterica subsp. enterica]
MIACDGDVSAIIAAVNTTKICRVNEFHMPSKAWARKFREALRLEVRTLGTVRIIPSLILPGSDFSAKLRLDDDGILYRTGEQPSPLRRATPVLFRQLPVQRSGQSVLFRAYKRSTGVIVRAPLAAQLRPLGD